MEQPITAEEKVIRSIRCRNWIATIPCHLQGAELLYITCVKETIERNGGKFAGQVEVGGIGCYCHIQAAFMFPETKSFDQIKSLEQVWQASMQIAYNEEKGESGIDGTQLDFAVSKIEPMFFQWPDN